MIQTTDSSNVTDITDQVLSPVGLRLKTRN